MKLLSEIDIGTYLPQYSEPFLKLLELGYFCRLVILFGLNNTLKTITLNINNIKIFGGLILFFVDSKNQLIQGI